MPVFLPPELAAEEDWEAVHQGQAGVTVDLMRQLYFQRQGQSTTEAKVEKKLVSLVFDYARRVIAHPSRPQVVIQETWARKPWGELAIEETLEEAVMGPDMELTLDPESLLVESTQDKPLSVVAMMDASTSMSGEKHLLASVASAVLLLEVKPEDASVIVFSSSAHTVKPLSVREAPQLSILKFLRHRPRGFTNIAAGLKEGLDQFRRFGSGKRKLGLLATDGRSTEGRDPQEIARQFDCLVVLHLHGPGSHLESSQLMAAQGNGVCLEVENFFELPGKLYEAVRLLARS